MLLNGVGLVNPSFAGAALRATILGLCGIVAGVYLLTSFASVGYPYLLEWMEGGTAEGIHRILTGHPLYVRPTLDYTPYIYPPLYFWLSGGAAALIGDELLAARAVSFVSTLLAAGLLYAGSSRIATALDAGGGRQHFYGIVAAALYLGCYELSGRWYNLARVDSLYIALLLLGFWLTRDDPGWFRSAAAGLVCALAFLTKQTAVVAIGPLLLSLLLVDLRRHLPAVIVFAVVGGGSMLLLDALSGGWSTYYLYDLPRAHRLDILGGTKDFVLHDTVGQIAIATVGAGAALLMLPRRLPWREWLPIWSLAVGMIASSWLARIHTGGYHNVSMPLFATIALLSPLGLLSVVSSPAYRKRWGALALAIAAVQVAVLVHNPWHKIPTEEDAAKMRVLLAWLKETPGDVLMFDMAFVQRSTGKSPYVLEMAARDVLRARGGRVRQGFSRALQEALDQKRFSALVLTEGMSYRSLEPALSRNYVPAGRILPQGSRHVIQGGVPNLIYRPAPSSD
jgi:dolichyl-phosphate-mannose-protein mannosyltransferase